MLLEGFAEFHQRSVWHFQIINNLEPNEYIFPLVTPALVREQHLLIAGRFNHYIPWDLAANPFDMRDCFDESDESSDKIMHIFSPKSSTMAVVNLMTASAEAHDTVTRMKIDFHIEERHWSWTTALAHASTLRTCSLIYPSWIGWLCIDTCATSKLTSNIVLGPTSSILSA
jgi:hypothetical protein